MAKKFLLCLFLAGLWIVLAAPTYALEKEKLGSAVKLTPEFYLPALAAEEKGFWKDNVLDVEWVPFASGVAIMHAIAAAEIKIGMDTSSGALAAAERGLPLIMVSELVPSYPFIMWVRADSPYRNPGDLKGKPIGVTALGTPSHVYARVISKAHGVEKDVRFIGTGGTPQQMAAIKIGAVEAIVNPLGVMVTMKTEGIIRELASSADYVPNPWFDLIIFARRDFARSKPDVVRKMLRATLQSTDFIRKNPRWAIDKMKSFQGLSEEAAKFMYGRIQFTNTGKLERKAVENIRKIFIEYGVITEKAPAVDDLFTNEYLAG